MVFDADAMRLLLPVRGTSTMVVRASPSLHLEAKQGNCGDDELLVEIDGSKKSLLFELHLHLQASKGIR